MENLLPTVKSISDLIDDFELAIPRTLGAGINMVVGFAISVACRSCFSAP